jgi:C1A family cysteine protease
MTPQNLPTYTSQFDPAYAAQMKMTAMPKYHWQPDPSDRQFPTYSIAAPGVLPKRVDLRQYASPVDDQGRLGSCTGNALAGAIDLLENKDNKINVRVSRLFIYYQERVTENDINLDHGAYIHDGVTACTEIGIPLETVWPYDINQFAVKPSDAAYADAGKRKVTGSAKCQNIDDIKTALSNGHPVVGGFTVYQSFESPYVARTGIMHMPNVNQEQNLGGHAVCFVGYDDARSVFIVRNSWGINWGDHGYFYMPYSVITTPDMSSDFWAISAVTNL